VNLALRTLSYIPAAGFSALYDASSSRWSPPDRKEEIHVRVDDIAAALGTKQSSTRSTVEDWLPVTVRPVASTPELTLLTPPNTDTAVNLLLTSATSDIVFCGGAVVCECPESALACIKVHLSVQT
jgi:hypothetical protein